MKESTKQKIREYDKEYKKRIYKSYTFRLNRETDKEIIEFLSSVEDKTNYIKDIIKEKMKKEL